MQIKAFLNGLELSRKVIDALSNSLDRGDLALVRWKKRPLETWEICFKSAGTAIYYYIHPVEMLTQKLRGIRISDVQFEFQHSSISL